MDLVHLARYPFHPEAAAYVREHGPTAEELLTERAYQRARDRGRQRILDALREGELPEPKTGSEVDCELELLSYVIARMVLAAVRDTYLTRRLAIAESKRVSRLLRTDEPRLVVTLSADEGLHFTLRGGKFTLPFAEQKNAALPL